ncbi:MAG: hypothetical protein RIQ81_2674 [Pseudomonadota bacterium]
MFSKKFFALILGVLISSAASASEIKKGHVLCSADFPAQVGFDLVQYKDAAKKFQGSFTILEDLVVHGSFEPMTETFEFSLQRVVDEFDNVETLLTNTSTLTAGETWKMSVALGAAHGNRVATFTCRSHWYR